MGDVKGKHLWYDLMTTDPTGARAFYTKAIGWGTETWGGGDPDMPYEMWTTEHGPMGGVMQLPEEASRAGAPPHWLAYVGTPDVDATAERAEVLGGRVLLAPMDIPGVGRIATLADPFGAVFAIFRPEGPTEPREGMPREGEVSWHELMTGDVDRALAFYEDLFGWRKGEPLDLGPMGVYQIFHTGEHPAGGIMKQPAEVPVSAWVYYVRVPDLEAALERVRQEGGQVVVEPMEVPGGDRVAQCVDPQGAWFALHWTETA